MVPVDVPLTRMFTPISVSPLVSITTPLTCAAREQEQKTIKTAASDLHVLESTSNGLGFQYWIFKLNSFIVLLFFLLKTMFTVCLAPTRQTVFL